MSEIDRTCWTALVESLGVDRWELESVSDGDTAKFVRARSADIFDGVRIDLTLRRGGLSLDPMVSVTHREVATLAARFLGRKAGALHVSSLSFVVRAATGVSGTSWVVRSEADIHPVVADLSRDLKRYGESFFEQYGSLDALIGKLDQLVANNPINVGVDLEHLAVARALTGDSEGVRAALSLLEDKAKNPSPMHAERAQKFIPAYCEYFGIQR